MTLYIILGISIILLILYNISLNNQLQKMRKTNNSSIRVAKKSLSSLSNFHELIINKYGIDRISKLDLFVNQMSSGLKMTPDDYEGSIIFDMNDII